MSDQQDSSVVDVIRDIHRLPTTTAIEETQVVELGGVRQVVSIRGRDRSNPVILFVHGGPGTPLAPTGWMWQRPLEEYFTVVHYDQRAAGRSHRLTDRTVTAETLHVDSYVADAVELATWLVGHLGTERITIAGHSWGTVVATLAVARAPELFAAYVGIGQVVHFRRAERASIAWARAEARRRGHEQAIADLDALGDYPGEGAFDMAALITERRWVQEFGGFAAGRDNCDYFMDGIVGSPDYTAEDQQSVLDGNALHAEVMTPQLAEVDLTGVTDVAVPVIHFHGRHDHMTPPELAVEWLDRLTAPAKATEWFEDSAHMPMYEEPGHFLLALLRHLRPGTT